MTFRPTGSGPGRNTSASKVPAISVAVLFVSALLCAQPAGFRVQPRRPIAELTRQALEESPPHEKGPFRQPDLVDLATLPAPLHFDIRYATSNNFLGAPAYSEARAFLARPAADALLQAARDFERAGYGILIHDAYRPWYVTKIFWDATPAGLHRFVADPAKGSKHNRGCAVDMSLYDLRTGEPVRMPSGYDEMTKRAHPHYGGGTPEERGRRDLLRRVMEAHGFTVDRGEWWHFDYRDWTRYPLSNIPFDKIGIH